MLSCGDAEREPSEALHPKASAFQAKVAEERAASAKLVFITEVLDEDGEAVPSVRVNIGVRYRIARDRSWIGSSRIRIKRGTSPRMGT